MKHNYFILTAIAFVFSIAFSGCKKDTPETVTPKITNDKVEVTATSATFTWTVEWVGNRVSVVELSENEDMSHSQFYGSEEELNKTEYIVTVNDLQPATKYYYRFWVWNQNYVNNKFVMETKWFTTETDLPQVITLPVSEVSWTMAKGGGNVTNDCGSEVTERGICWSENPKPTINDAFKASGSGTGSFSVQMEDLEPEKTYYVRAYAKNAKGIGYGEDESFITNETLLPDVTTAEVTEIAWRTAVGGGEVTSENGATVTERGICWSTEHDPIITNGHANSGTGLGAFSVNMTGLTAGTTYYARAYAKNSAGWTYGNEVTFRTQDPLPPTVTTNSTSSITWTSAKVNCSISVTDGTSVYERGLCWSTSTNPNYWGHHVTSGSGSGSFTVTLSELNPETIYYVRAYARSNVEDLTYGDTLSFKTNDLELPSVTTSEVTQIAQRTAKGGGNVTSNGGAPLIERGICWSAEHASPSIEAGDFYLTHNNASTGDFTIQMTGLTPNTNYYVCAWARNSVGIKYGNSKSFTTLEIQKPTLTNPSVEHITDVFATLMCSVSNDGGDDIIDRGFCISSEHDPINDEPISCGPGAGTFSLELTDLMPNTKYYFRVYATNSAGTTVRELHTFTTCPDYYNLLPGYWFHSWMEQGYEHVISFYINHDIQRIIFEHKVYNNDDDDYGIYAVGTYVMVGNNIYAYYERPTVEIDFNWTPGTFHGFTNGVSISVNYEIVSCNEDELVVIEDVEGQTITVYRSNAKEMKEFPESVHRGR